MPSTVDLGSVRVACQQTGDGPSLVLVHGSNSDYRTWQAVSEDLAASYRVVTYSRRYHWPNDTIAEGADYSMAEHVRDLGGLIERLDVAPVHLVGHSYGGFVSLLFAMQSPDLVRSLVLTEPPVLTLFTSSIPTPAEMLRLLFTRPGTALSIAKFGATGVAPATAAVKNGDLDLALRKIGSAVLGRQAFRNLEAERLEQARANMIPAELLGSGFPPLEDDEVRSVACPVLLMVGERSPRLFHRLATRLGRLLPNVERVAIPAASHLVHEDNPKEWLKTVRAFTARQDAV
jgi:pimeloyl-ACP methyl ester carboxylesterase